MNDAAQKLEKLLQQDLIGVEIMYVSANLQTNRRVFQLVCDCSVSFVELRVESAFSAAHLHKLQRNSQLDFFQLGRISSHSVYFNIERCLLFDRKNKHGYFAGVLYT